MCLPLYQSGEIFTESPCHNETAACVSDEALKKKQASDALSSPKTLTTPKMLARKPTTSTRAQE